MIELFHADPLSVLSILLGAASLLALFIDPSRRFALALFFAYLIMGIVAGRMHPLAIVWPLPLAMAVAAFHNLRGWRKIAVGLWVLVLAGLLGFHYAPGFYNWNVFDQAVMKPGCVPHTLWLNWDKPIVGFPILWFVARPEEIRLRKTLGDLAIIGVPGLVLMLGAALLSGYVAWEPAVPMMAGAWAFANLLSCIAEEALFRGFLQKAIGGIPGLIIASIVFGAAHYPMGGPIYAALAALAGLLYGSVYRRSGRIESSILIHWSLNLLHFFLLSYPALQR